MSKSEIEKKIHEYGGRVVQNPGKTLMYSFYNKMNNNYFIYN